MAQKRIKTMDDKQIIKEIEKVLVEVYRDDDSYIADYIVGTVREIIGDPNFAKGASFSDRVIEDKIVEGVIQYTPEETKNRPYKGE